MGIQNPVTIGGVYSGGSTPTVIPCAVDVNGNLIVDATFTGTISGNAAAGPTGSAVPSNADYIGINVGGLLVGISASNPLPITGSISATNPSVGSTGATAPTSATELGIIIGGNLVGVSSGNPIPVSIPGTIGVIQSTSPWVTQPTTGGVYSHNLNQDVSGNVGVNVQNSVAVTGTFFQGTQPVSIAGTVNVSVQNSTLAVTQSTSPWIVAGGGTAGSPGTAALTIQGISGGTAVPISGTVSVTNFANPLPVSQSGTWTVGISASQTIAVTQTTAANLNATVVFPSAQPVTLTSTTVTGTVAVTQSTSPWVVSGTIAFSNSSLSVTQGTSPWVDNITQVAGVALGSTGVVNYGSTPAAVAVPGVNAFVTNTPTVNIAASQTIAVTNTGTFAVQAAQSGTWTVQQGTPPWSVTFPSAQAVTLTSTTITGTVAVTQSTSPWVVSGTVSIGNFPATQAVTQSTNPWVTQDVSAETSLASILSGQTYQNQEVDVLNKILAQLRYHSLILANGLNVPTDDLDLIDSTFNTQ